jgi:hypothetical protein
MATVRVGSVAIVACDSLHLAGKSVRVIERERDRYRVIAEDGRVAVLPKEFLTQHHMANSEPIHGKYAYCVVCNSEFATNVPNRAKTCSLECKGKRDYQVKKMKRVSDVRTDEYAEKVGA